MIGKSVGSCMSKFDQETIFLVDECNNFVTYGQAKCGALQSTCFDLIYLLVKFLP